MRSRLTDALRVALSVVVLAVYGLVVFPATALRWLIRRFWPKFGLVDMNRERKP
jgi:hypothetical protein